MKELLDLLRNNPDTELGFKYIDSLDCFHVTATTENRSIRFSITPEFYDKAIRADELIFNRIEKTVTRANECTQ